MNTIPMLNRIAALILCALAINGTLRGETPTENVQEIDDKDKVTLEDVKTMNDAGVTDDKIIHLIQSTGTVYYLTPADIAGLKKAGVSKRVIDYMQQTPYRNKTH